MRMNILEGTELREPRGRAAEAHVRKVADRARNVADRSGLGKLVLLSMFCSACELVLGDIPDKPVDDAGLEAGSVEELPGAMVDADVPTDARDAQVVFSDAAVRADSATDTGTSSDAGAITDTLSDAGVVTPPCPADQLRTVYRDADGDGHGDATSVQVVCGAVPAAYAAVAGDCNDQDVNVHPGQETFFGAGYTPRNGTGGVSFDYDCDGDEVAGPDQNLAPTTCVGLLVCLGGGYLPNGARPKGQGVNIYCGSNVKSLCTGSGLLCQDSPSTTDARYVCN